MLKFEESIHPLTTKEAKRLRRQIVLTVSLVLVGFSIVFLYYYFDPMVIDNLGLKYLRDIKPEDRGLEIQNVSGFCNGTVILNIKNNGNHSVVIKDVILESQMDPKIKVTTSITKEIPEHSSNIIVSVWFPESLQVNQRYEVEVFTQRGSYIGDMHGSTHTTFSIET